MRDRHLALSWMAIAREYFMVYNATRYTPGTVRFACGETNLGVDATNAFPKVKNFWWRG